jgi:hypothetical protein
MVVYAKEASRPAVLGELVQKAKEQEGRVDFDVVTDPAAIGAAVAKSNLTILILSVQAGDAFPELLGALSQLQTRIQSGLLRAVALNAIDHPRVLMLLKSNGVSDIVEPGLTLKALNLRIQNALRAVTQSYQRLKNQKMKPSTVIGGGKTGVTSVGSTRSDGDLLWTKSPDHLCDHWWLPSPKHIRNVMGRWLIDLLGPSPAAGQWMETDLERDGERGWEWKLRPGSDPAFQAKPGRWICYGKQPEFVWAKNTWSFVSKTPSLALHPDGSPQAEFERFGCVGGRLRMNENSVVARDAEGRPFRR